MTTVILFPQSEAGSERMVRLDEAWLILADERLVEYTWVWPEGPPGWVGDGWAKWIAKHRRGRALIGPQSANWPELWIAFLASELIKTQEWRDAVERALEEIEGDAA